MGLWLECKSSGSLRKQDVIPHTLWLMEGNPPLNSPHFIRKNGGRQNNSVGFLKKPYKRMPRTNPAHTPCHTQIVQVTRTQIVQVTRTQIVQVTRTKIMPYTNPTRRPCRYEAGGQVSAQSNPCWHSSPPLTSPQILRNKNLGETTATLTR
jgi:hypothetical protein